MSVSRIDFLPSVLFSTRVPAESHAGDMLSVVPYLALARELAALFTPVAPRPEFRADLERTLIADARRQSAESVLFPVAIESREGGERRWVMVSAAAAAAVGSAVSIAGIVVYVLRRRDRAA
ncbi:MAG: hypothetical protein MUC34_11575 [Anaerolineae bacterium]|jgi:hypothetical protein|nr:hypothetical protein [Anaerolineae bacterium]